MSPQEAAKQLAEIKMLLNSTMYFKERQALKVAIAALEREAKSEPVAWKVLIPRGTDAYEIRFTSLVEQLREMEAKWPLALVEPLYASPPAPGDTE